MKMLVASTHMRYADGCEQGQKHIIQGHQNILEAIKIKSPKMAHKAMLELLEKSMQIIKKYNQYRKLDFLIKRVIY